MLKSPNIIADSPQVYLSYIYCSINICVYVTVRSCLKKLLNIYSLGYPQTHFVAQDDLAFLILLSLPSDY